jgi:hypothetical protein
MYSEVNVRAGQACHDDGRAPGDGLSLLVSTGFDRLDACAIIEWTNQIYCTG